MSTNYEDWTDWAGDHPEQAEADLRAKREKDERRADELARKAVKAVMDQHRPNGPYYPIGLLAGEYCKGCRDPWPCETVRLLSEAEEAISEAEDLAA